MYEEAIQDFSKAIEFNPKYSNAFNNRGLAKSSIGKKLEAIEDFSKAIEFSPLNADFYMNRGSTKNDLG